MYLAHYSTQYFWLYKAQNIFNLMSFSYKKILNLHFHGVSESVGFNLHFITESE